MRNLIRAAMIAFAVALAAPAAPVRVAAAQAEAALVDINAARQGERAPRPGSATGREEAASHSDQEWGGAGRVAAWLAMVAAPGCAASAQWTYEPPE